MSTALTALVPFVAAQAPSCPNAVAVFHIRQAAIEFCRRTLIWRSVLAPVLSALPSIAFTAPLVAATSGTLAAPFAGPTRTDYIITFDDTTQQPVTLVNGSTAVSWANPVTAGVNATYTQLAYTIPATTDGSVIKLLKFTVDGIKRRVVTPDMGEDLVLYRYTQEGIDQVAWTMDRLTFQVSPPPTVAGTKYALIVALEPTQTATTMPDYIYDAHAEDLAAGAIARVLSLPEKAFGDVTKAKDKRAYFESRINTIAGQVAKGYSRGRRRVTAHTF